MPSSKKPQSTDLSGLLQGLNEAGIEYIVVGGLAAVIQGAPVTTFDLDIVHRRTDQNIKNLIEFLKTVSAIQRRPDDKIVFPQFIDFSGTGHLQLITSLGPLDVLSVIEKGQGFDELKESAIEIDYKGHKTLVLRLESLVALKRESNLQEDRYRMQIYEETLRLRNESDDIEK